MTGRKETILYADDDATARVLMGAALERAGFAVQMAIDGDDAIRHLRKGSYDLVMLDVEMPGRSGFEVCRELRAEVGKELPIVMVTGHDELRFVEQAFELGATDFISKPINWALIGHRLRYLLRGRQLLVDLQRSERQLKDAQRLARIGSWDLDPATGLVGCSEAMLAIFELRPGAHGLPLEDLLGRVHPQDRECAQRAFSADDRCEAHGNAHVYRVVMPDGRQKFVRQEAEVQCEPGRRVSGIVGTAQEITEQHVTQQALASLATTLATLSGSAFHESVSHHLVEALGLDLAFVGRLDSDRQLVQVTAGWKGEGSLQPFEYPLTGTASADILERGYQVYPSDVKALFPGDAVLTGDKLESCIGTPLLDKRNNVIGILVAAGKRPIDRPELASRILGIFNGPVVTEMMRTQAESTAARLSAYRQMILELSTEFIRMRPDEVDVAIDRALGRMAEFFQADRAYLFSYDFSARTTSNIHEWCAPGTPPEIDNLQSLPMDLIPDWVDVHREGRALVVQEVGVLPPGRLREVLEPQGIKSLITFPMIHDDQPLGFVGFDAVREVVRYGADEVELLRLFADLLVNVEARRQAEQALRESEQLLKQAQAVARLGSWFYDLKADELHWSAETFRIFGVPEGRLLNYESVISFVHPDDRQAVEAVWAAALVEGDLRIEHRIMVGEEVRWVLEQARLSRDGEGRPIAGIGTVQDITERKQQELAIVEARNKLRNTLEAIPDLLFEVEISGRITDCHVPSQVGLDFGQLGEACLHEALPPEAAETFAEALREANEQGSSLGRLIELETTEGSRWFELSASRKANGSMASAAFVVLARDVTARREAEQKVYRLAYFDPLTGLPNRLSFAERLEREIYRARRNGEKLGILFLDLDGFKNINDTMGHGTGDLLLQWVADRLRLSVRPADMVARVDTAEQHIELARLGGDEFTVLVPHIEDGDDVLGIAHRIHEQLRRPFQLEGRDVVLTTSMGISVYPEDGEDGATLLKHADTAMYHAKDEGRDNCQFYSASLTQQALRRLDLENSLRRALDRDEFFLMYQPQLDLASGRVESVEALIRWQHPERGLMSPAEFIPAAEENGLIVPIGDWVMRKACADAMRWHAEGHPLRVAVNLSARQFRDPRLAERIEDILAESGLPADRLELEVTEGSLMEDTESTLATLKRLREIGMRLSLDDFGTGYSSLSYLKRLPLNNLKVDRSFVRGLPSDHDNLAIVRAILSMAQNLGFTVTAEGVETVEQGRCLRDLNCDLLQGYYIGMPVGVGEVAALIDNSALDAIRRTARPTPRRLRPRLSVAQQPDCGNSA